MSTIDTHKRDELMAVLRNQQLAVISTISPESTPESATVFYSVDNDLNIFFSTRQSSRKYANIQKNSPVALVVTDPEHMVTVQIEGKAEETFDAEEMRAFIDSMMTLPTDRSQLEKWMAPGHLMKNGHFAIMKVTPAWIRIGDFRNVQSDSTDYFYEFPL